MHRRIANIVCQLWMSDNVHLLWATTCLPKFFLGETLDLAGPQFFQALQNLPITDVMRFGV